MKTTLFILMFLPFLALAQVGIGTTNPQATLDVRDPDPTTPTAASGISIPQVDVLPATGNRGGQILYLTPSTNYYYFNGTSWLQMSTNDTRVYGDIKQGIQPVDHNGWVLLDGRALTSLSTSQQAQAAALGLTANLPDASGRVLRMNGTLLQTGGASSVALAQTHLPLVNFTGSTNTTGNHAHAYADRYRNTELIRPGLGTRTSVGSNNLTTSNRSTNSSGNHNHTVTVSSGGGNQPIPVEDPYLSVHHFMYLGL